MPPASTRRCREWFRRNRLSRKRQGPARREPSAAHPAKGVVPSYSPLVSTTQKALTGGIALGLLAILVSVVVADESVDANIGAGLLGVAGIGLSGACAIGLVVTFALGRRRTRR
jgi:hypothetical protein